MATSSVIDTLREALPGASLAEGPATDMPTVYVDREHLIDVLLALRDHPSLQFALLSDLTAADYLPATPRFEVVYHLACLGAAYTTAATAAPARRLRLKVRIADDDARVPSAVPVFPVAGWLEREVFDLFGLSFDGHPDLRRILTADDWEGYPLRKDYPVQIRKNTATWEPVQLSVQEFAENMRVARERAKDQARAVPGPAADPAGRGRRD